MAILPLSFLIGPLSFLQVTMTCIKALMSSNFGQIPVWTTELAALEHLKNLMYNLVAILAPSFLLDLHVCR